MVEPSPRPPFGGDEASRFHIMGEAEEGAARNDDDDGDRRGCRIVPFTLCAEGRAHAAAATVDWVMFADGWYSTRRKQWYRSLCSPSLREAMQQTLLEHRASLQRLAHETGKEQTGVLMCKRQSAQVRHRGGWLLTLIPCPKRSVNRYISTPNCKNTSTCNPDPRWDQQLRPKTRAGEPNPWVLVGEFHTHPQDDPRHIKPASGDDIYQVIIHAMNNLHGAFWVIAPEGLYVYHARLTGIHRMEADLDRYFRDHRDTNGKAQISTCRVPLRKGISAVRHPHLHGILLDLEKFYHHLMLGVTSAKDSSHQHHLVQQYHHHTATRFHVEGHFWPWRSDPRTMTTAGSGPRPTSSSPVRRPPMKRPRDGA